MTETNEKAQHVNVTSLHVITLVFYF